MNSSCLRRCSFQPICWAIYKPATEGLSSAQSSFFSRFYSVATTSLRPDCSRRLLQYSSHSQQQQVRAFHDSLIHLTRAPPRTPPKRTTAERQTSKRKAAAPPSLGELDETQLAQVFGSPISSEQGNSTLQTLQYRRITGSLIEHGLKIQGSDLPWDLRARGLAWLREQFPFDEKHAATEWADRAAEELQETYISRAEKFKLIRKRSEDEIRQQREVQSPSAVSAFDRIRARNEEKAEKAAEARKKSGEEQRSNELRLARIEEQRSLREQRELALEERKERIEREGRISDMSLEEATAALTTFQRLAPSTAFVLLFTTVCLYGAEVYSPPGTSERMWPDLPPSVATVTTFSCVCLGVTLAQWIIPLHRLWNKTFLSIPAWPYAVSMAGNCVAHKSFVHLGANLAALWFYGISLHESVGRGNFVAILCISGVFGSLSSLYFNVLRGVLSVECYGASGAMWGIMMAWAALRFSSEKDHEDDSKYQRVLDIARYGLIFFQFILHLWPGASTAIDVASHLGGGIAGTVGASLLQARAMRKDTQAAEQMVEYTT